MASQKEVRSLYGLCVMIIVTILWNNYAEERRNKKNFDIMTTTITQQQQQQQSEGGGGLYHAEVKHPKHVALPSVYSNVVDVWIKPTKSRRSYYNDINNSDRALQQQDEEDDEEELDESYNDAIPIFWQMDRSGGSSITRVLGTCLSLVQASSMPSLYDNLPFPAQLSVSRIHESKHTTVDLTTPQGIRHAKVSGLLTTYAYLTDFIVTKTPFAIAQSLLDLQHKGRIFVLLRHPVHTAVSIFNHIKHLPKHHTQYDPKLQIMPIQDWAIHNHPTFPDNVLTRTILGYKDVDAVYPRALSQLDLDTAKQILKTKVLVGLLEQKGSSMKRFTTYFLWDDESPFKNQARLDECLEKCLHWGWLHKSQSYLNNHDYDVDNQNQFQQQQQQQQEQEKEEDVLQEDSPVYQLIKQKNMFDYELYEYAKYLFWYQGEELDL